MGRLEDLCPSGPGSHVGFGSVEDGTVHLAQTMLLYSGEIGFELLGCGANIGPPGQLEVTRPHEHQLTVRRSMQRGRFNIVDVQRLSTTQAEEVVIPITEVANFS